MKRKSSVRISKNGNCISFSGPIANEVFKAMSGERPSDEAAKTLRAVNKIASAYGDMNNTHPDENHP